MIKSFLIQRLNKPLGNTNWNKLIKSMVFGGGLVNGGLSQNAMKLLQKIFSFDYMGASEFEWGAIPKALKKIVENKETITCVHREFYYEYYSYCNACEKIDRGKCPVYVICPKNILTDVLTIIEYHAIHHYAKPPFHTKEMVKLNESMSNSVVNTPQGWLEIDNGYFFFTSAKMAKLTAKLLGFMDWPL